MLMDPFDDTTNLMAFLLLLARIGDVGSTYLATPTLKLETNPIARRFKWPFAVLTLFAAAIPYYSLPLGVGILVASLLVSASNLSGIWLVRAMGECEYHKLIVRLAGQTRVSTALVFIAGQAICIAAIGLLLLPIPPIADGPLSSYVPFGFFAYAFAIILWQSLAFLRLHRLGNTDQQQ